MSIPNPPAGPARTQAVSGPSAHTVLIDLLNVLSHYYVPIWGGETADGRISCDSYEEDKGGKPAMTRLWRNNYDRMHLLAEIAREIKDPLAEVRHRTVRGAIREVCRYLNDVGSFRAYQAYMLSRTLYSPDEEDLEELGNIRDYRRYARNDATKYRSISRMLNRAQFPLAFLPEHQVPVTESEDPSACSAKAKTGPDSSVAPTATNDDTQRVFRPADGVGRVMGVKSVFAMGFSRASSAVHHCVGRVIHLLNKKAMSDLIAIANQPGLTCGTVNGRDEVNGLWVFAFDTLRQASEIALWDVDDPFGPISKELTLALGDYCLDFTISYRDVLRANADVLRETEKRNNAACLHQRQPHNLDSTLAELDKWIEVVAEGQDIRRRGGKFLVTIAD